MFLTVCSLAMPKSGTCLKSGFTGERPLSMGNARTSIRWHNRLRASDAHLRLHHEAQLWQAGHAQRMLTVSTPRRKDCVVPRVGLREPEINGVQNIQGSSRATAWNRPVRRQTRHDAFIALGVPFMGKVNNAPKSATADAVMNGI